jgi:hypothetical protein
VLRQIFEDLHDQCDSQEMDTFSVIARKIWLRRNLMVHENFLTHPSRVVQEAVMALDEFWKANSVEKEPAISQGEISRITWQLSPENMIKINWLFWARKTEAIELIFEGDASLVVQAVNAQEPCNCTYGHIVEGIQDSLKGFNRMSFEYIARDGNYAAHGLAKEATLRVMDTTWRNEIPPRIYDIVMKEGSTRSL